MHIGHPTSRCNAPRTSLDMEADPRPSPKISRHPHPRGRETLEVFLPPPLPPPRGTPALSGCMAKLEIGLLDPVALKDPLPSKLAGHFGGSASDYKVASLCDSSLVVVFPNWVARGSAIGRSPLWLDGVPLAFSDWAEPEEVEHGHLRHKVRIRLLNWPIICWSVEEVTAAVSGFGELWEADERSTGLDDVSCFRVLVRCRDVDRVPEALSLTVEDRRFRIPIVVESWEAAEPILLGEDTDRQLGLVTWEDQESFRHTTGFSSSTVAGPGCAAHAPSGQSSSGGVNGVLNSQLRSSSASVPHWPDPPPPLLCVGEDQPGLAPFESSPPGGRRERLEQAPTTSPFPPPLALAPAAGLLPDSSLISRAPGHPGGVDQGPPLAAVLSPILKSVALESSGPAPVQFSCTSFPASGKLSHRRSSRLAAKHKGAKKLTLSEPRISCVGSINS